MRSLWIAALAAMLGCAGAHAQTASVNGPCGSAGYVAGQGAKSTTQDPGGDLCVGHNPGSYTNGSIALSTTAANVFAAPGTGLTRVRLVLLNTDLITPGGGAGIYIWCRYATVALGAAAAHGTGSFLLPPGGGFDINGPGVPQGAVNCIAESGTPKLYAEQE